MIKRVLTALALAGVLLPLAGCTPHEGDNCPSEGSYYTHTGRGKHVELRCIDGRWRKL
jgi:hypothetical protein